MIRIAILGLSLATAEEAKKNILLLADKLNHQVQITYCGDDFESLPAHSPKSHILVVENEVIKTTAAKVLPMLDTLSITMAAYRLPIGESCFKSWIKLISCECITIPLVKGRKIELISDIAYFENKDRRINVRTADNYYATSLTMKQASELVVDHTFFSPYVGFLVNLAWVERISSRDIILNNQENIPLSQKRAATFRKQYLNFCKSNQS